MFGFFNKKEKAATVNQNPAPVAEEQVGKVSLAKSKVSLEKSIINLSKEKSFDLGGIKAKFVVVMDRSGSMDEMFRKGKVQDALTRLLPLGLRFDDDGTVEVYVFNNNVDDVADMTEQNYQNFVQNEILNKGLGPDGGTNYAPALRKVVKNRSKKIPTFCIFVTDGDNWDKDQTTEVIRESSKMNVFFQFVGLGNDSFSYLRKLDDLTGRAKDNTGFISVASFDSVDDEELFRLLLEQFVDFLK